MSAIKNYFKEEFQISMLRLEHPKRTDFYLSGCQKSRSAVPLLIWRVFLFLSALGIVLASIILYIQSGIFGYWFIYLTHWGLMSILLSTGFSVAVSARIYLYGPISAEFQLPWYVKVYWVLYNIATPLAFLITIFYWTLLYNSGTEEELNHALDVAVHGANSIIMLLLLLGSSQPSRILHIVHPLIFALVYVLFGVIYYVAGGTDSRGNPYVYPVVDWTSPGTTMIVVAITGLLLIVVHLFTVAITAARDAITAQCFHKSVIVHVDEGVPLRQRPQAYA